MIIVIDDERTFKGNVDLYLRTVDEALSYLAQRWLVNQMRPMGAPMDLIDQLWFDHDLGASGDAIVIARFVSELNDIGRPIPIRRIFIHSQNPIGAQRLHIELKNCAEKVARCSLPQLIEPEPEYLEVKEWGNDEPIMKLQVPQKRS